MAMASPNTLWLVGRRVYQASRQRNYLTPAEMFGERFGE